MLFMEWNQDDAIAVAREEAYEDGREEGEGIGLEKGIEKAREENRKLFFELLDQGLSIDEIKRCLENT